MTNTRSRASRSNLWAALVVLCALLGAGGIAEAGRKRVVVLDFEGPKGDKFHDELVKLIKKTHTVVPTDKWNGTAEEMDASAVSEKNVKKVAKKLKVDAVVEGKIEKRRDEFIIRLKLREGKSGEQVGNSIDTKAEGPRIEGRAQRDLKDEFVDAIGNVESNHLGTAGDDEPVAKNGAKKTDDEGEDKPVAKKAAKKTDDEDEDKPVKKGFSKHADDERGSEKVAEKKAAKKTGDGDDEDKLPAKKVAKKTGDGDDEDKLPAKKVAKKTADGDEDKLPAKKAAKKTDEDEDKLPAKKVAKKTADGDDEDKLPAKKVAKKTADGDEDKLPAKKLAKKTDDEDKLPAKKAAKKADDGEDKPVKKKVASRDDDGNTEVDAEAGPPLDAATALAPGERALDAVLGLSVTARRMAFKIRSGLLMKPPNYRGTPVGGAMIDATVYPLAVGHKRGDMLKNIGLSVMYDRVFKVNSKDATGKVFASTEARFGFGGVFRYAFNKTAMAPVVIGSLGYSSQAFSITSGTLIGIPNVKYTIFEPGAGLRLPITSKLLASVDAKLMAITNAGQIQDASQYGASSVLGFEGALGVDYLITPNIFARVAFRAETIGLSFKGTGVLGTTRDGDPASKNDVSGARDTYLGGIATVGYLY